MIVEAHGIHVKDADGRVYIDCLAGAGTLALGHNHPVVIEAMQNVLTSGVPLHTLDLLTPIKDQFVDELFDSLPAQFAQNAKVQFCGPTGADATEAAVKLVKTATGRRSMVSFQGGYHGMTHGSLSLTGNLNAKNAVANLMPEVQFLPYPYSYRCPFGVGGEATARISAHYIKQLLDDPEGGVTKPAGMIVEIVQGEGGVIPAPDTWVQEMRRLTREREIPMIVDEIQAGIGRTGKLFAFEHAGITPDVVVISKAIGGSLPLAVVLYNKELDRWQPGAHAGTFRGNVLAMAAGMATLRYIRQNDIPGHAAKVGARLMQRLDEVAAASHSIGEVRGRGLMVGVEFVDKNAAPDELGTYPANTAMARAVQQECLKRGLILELGGRHGCVARFLPPLIITAEQVDEVGAIFGEAVRAAEVAAK